MKPVPIELLEALAAEIKPPPPPPAQPAGTAFHRNGTANLMDRALAYVEKMPPAIQGDGGSDRAFAVACRLVEGFALSDDEARQILNEYNRRCVPAWNEKELEHKLSDARKEIDPARLGYLRDAQPTSNGTPASKLSDTLRQSENPPTAAPADEPHDTEPGDMPPDIEPPEAEQMPDKGPAADTVPPDAQEPPTAQDYHRTDVGNSKRFSDKHRDDARYFYTMKSWLFHKTTHWKIDDNGAAIRSAKKVIAEVFKEAAKRIAAIGKAMATASDEEKDELAKLMKAAKELLAWALKSEQAKLLNSMLELARSDLPITHQELDCDLYLFNVLNGTIDLRSGELRPHRREDFITKIAKVKYDPQAQCPLWMACLHKWMAGKTTLVEYLQRVVGYWLSGDVEEHAFWIFHGDGANGKSTFLLTILALLGDYGIQAVNELLVKKHHEAHPTERADLFKTRLACIIETEKGKELAESLTKQLTGGDNVRARKLFKDFFEFEATHKIVMGVNHLPELKGIDKGMWRRPRVVPWVVTISEQEKDKQLKTKLRKELPGILTWAVQGFLAWQRDGLRDPDEVTSATTNYRKKMDNLQAFLDACCVTGDENYRIGVTPLYEAYKQYTGDETTSRKEISSRLENMGYVNQRGTGGAFFWVGIGIPK